MSCRKSSWFVVPAALAALAPFAAAQTAPLSARGRWLVDAEGRVAILHGVNVSDRSKRPPFEPDLSVDDGVRLRALGFNVARVLAIWEAIEPQPDVFDRDYLRRLAGFVDRLHAAGLLVILDMHQDLYSRHLFFGDGAPEWAVTPRAHWHREPWALNYLAPGVRTNFNRFWRSPALQEHYALAWEALVRHFADHPAVIGYDLMNEPFPGSALPGDFERRVFAPWSARLADRLQALTPGRLVFFEPAVTNATRADLFDALRSAPDAPGAGRVFAPHYYDWLTEATHDFRAGAPWSEWGPRWFLGETTRHAHARGFPVLLGEWGMIQNWRGAVDYARVFAGLLDEHMLGWCWWSWDRVEDQGAHDPAGFGLLRRGGGPAPAAFALARAFPRVIAGVPEGWTFDPERRRFECSWRPDPAVTAPSEIVWPRLMAGGRRPVAAVADGVARWDFDPDAGILRAWAAPGAARCRVVVTPAQQ